MKRSVLLIVLTIFSLTVHAQILDKLKNTAKKVATDKKVQNAVFDRMEKAREVYDSTDFDYAVLVSDNSGSFNVNDKDGLLANAATGKSFATSAASWWNSSDKDAKFGTDEEAARYKRRLGEVAYSARRYKAAEDLFTAAKTKYEDAHLNSDIGYLKTIANQGLLYTTMGRFTLAENSTVEALDMRKEKYGDNTPAVAASYNNYGVLKYNTARYNEAEKDFETVIAILKANGQQGAMPYAIALNNQAMLFQSIGRYDEGVAALKEGLAIVEKVSKPKSKNDLRFQSNLALLYQQMGKYAEAESIYASMEKKLGKNSPDLAAVLVNQAALYMVMAKEDKVEELLKRAGAIYKSNLGEENPAYARAISDLGNFYRYKARYAEAEPLLDKALAIREIALGRNHPQYVQTEEDLAILHWKRKSMQKAYITYRDVMDKSLEFVNKYFPPMSEAEKTKYWDVMSPRFQRFYNFAVEASVDNAPILQDLYDYRIATKALLLNSTNKVKSAIFSSKDVQLIKDYVAWLDQKETLARLYAYSKTELKEQHINLDSIERAANGMEKKLSERSSEFSSGYGSQKISYSQIKGLLLDNEASVEIVRIQKYDQAFTKDSKYAALILTKATDIPKLVVLDNGQQLDTRYAKFYRNAIQQKSADEYSYDQYWLRIEPEIAGKKVIYFSPDGAYNQLNLNTMKKTGSDYVINRYDLVILGNSKDLIAIKAKKTKAAKKNAVLLGFPDYGGTEIAALPGTKVELDGISKVLKTAGYAVTPFMQKTATETNLKAVKGPVVMHIATHGFFLQDVDQEGSAFGVHMENAGDNPLLRSGLMLAGASKTVSGKEIPNLSSNDNGILTAYEAMNLNLEGTDLIVLSACETGLGDVKAGEGVYGLQRAFLVAGADALIMSLWKVDDAATQQLMTNFYTNWTKTGNKQKAFKQAQIQLMTKFKDPYYWGAFVMMGQ